MTDEEADQAVRGALAGVFSTPLVGEFIVIAQVYDNDGESMLATHVTSGLTTWPQLGMLLSTLIRTGIVDAQGWQRTEDDDD